MANDDIAALEAQLALSRAALADKILTKFASGSSSSSSSRSQKNGTSSASASSGPSSANQTGKKSAQSAAPSSSSQKQPLFEHRPPTLGLGAVQDPASSSRGIARADGTQNLSVDDARLKGRLVDRQGKIAAIKGKRKAETRGVSSGESSEDEEDVRGGKANGKGKAVKVDPFATRAKKRASQMQATQTTDTPTSSHTPASVSADQSSIPTAAASTNDDEGDTSAVQKLSKGQRQRLNKKKRKLEKQTTIPSKDVQTPLTAIQDPLTERAQPSSSSSVTTSTTYRPSGLLPAVEEAATSGSQTNAFASHQRALQQKLQGSQFRQLNESLYTVPSSSSFEAAQQDPSRMQAYHQGFREQTKKWPKKPFEMLGNIIAREIKQSWETISSAGATHVPAKGKKGKGASDPEGVVPRVAPGALIADLGAGEGPLTRYLASHPALTERSLPAFARPRVLAYDLLDTSDGVVRGVDCARQGGVPLPGSADGNGLHLRSLHASVSSFSPSSSSSSKSKSISASKANSNGSSGIVDVVVFCLSLMSTDWIRMILEARRVLRPGGVLLIAEVSSRLTSSPSALLDDNGGSSSSSSGGSGGGGGGGGGGKAVDKRAFVDLLQKVGFVDDSPAVEGDVDASTQTHFVLLRFHKVIDEELVVKRSSSSSSSSSSPAAMQLTDEETAKQRDREEEQRWIEEGREVLKPCLYKRR